MLRVLLLRHVRIASERDEVSVFRLQSDNGIHPLLRGFRVYLHAVDSAVRIVSDPCLELIERHLEIRMGKGEDRIAAARDRSADFQRRLVFWESHGPDMMESSLFFQAFGKESWPCHPFSGERVQMGDIGFGIVDICREVIGIEVVRIDASLPEILQEALPGSLEPVAPEQVDLHPDLLLLLGPARLKHREHILSIRIGPLELPGIASEVQMLTAS